jgi:hypothetical protein
MSKKSGTADDYRTEFLDAQHRISTAVNQCRETLPLVAVMAALGEALVETTDALMTTEQEMTGATTSSLLSASDLLQLVSRQIDMRAAALAMNPEMNHQVH